MFTKPHIELIAASFRKSFLLGQHKQHFSDSKLVNKATLRGGEVLFANFKNNSQIMPAIKDV